GWGDAERAERLGEELQLHLARLLEAGGEQDATALAADRFGLPTDAQGLGCVRALREHLELEAGVAVVDDLEACLASAGAAQADGLGGLGAVRQPELAQLAVEDEQRREPRRELAPEVRRGVPGDDAETVGGGAGAPRLAGGR